MSKYSEAVRRTLENERTRLRRDHPRNAEVYDRAYQSGMLCIQMENDPNNPERPSLVSLNMRRGDLSEDETKRLEAAVSRMLEEAAAENPNGDEEDRNRARLSAFADLYQQQLFWRSGLAILSPTEAEFAWSLTAHGDLTIGCCRQPYPLSLIEIPDRFCEPFGGHPTYPDAKARVIALFRVKGGVVRMVYYFTPDNESPVSKSITSIQAADDWTISKMVRESRALPDITPWDDYLIALTRAALVYLHEACRLNPPPPVST